MLIRQGSGVVLQPYESDFQAVKRPSSLVRCGISFDHDDWMDFKWHPTELILDGKRFYVIWTSGEEDEINRDRVLMDDHGVVWFNEVHDLLQYADEHDIVLFQRNVDDSIDIDAGISTLAQSDHLDCSAVMGAWNISWDFANGTRAVFDQRSVEHDAVYDKIFFGCNLPAVTPPGEHFVPEWDEEELDLLRRTVNQGVSLIRASIESPR
jgi:hypothetical protein